MGFDFTRPLRNAALAVCVGLGSTTGILSTTPAASALPFTGPCAPHYVVRNGHCVPAPKHKRHRCDGDRDRDDRRCFRKHENRNGHMNGGNPKNAVSNRHRDRDDKHGQH